MVHEVQSIRLGRAAISFHAGRPLSFPSAGLYVPMNSRGILAAGAAAEVRLAGGPDVEQEPASTAQRRQRISHRSRQVD